MITLEERVLDKLDNLICDCGAEQCEAECQFKVDVKNLLKYCTELSDWSHSGDEACCLARKLLELE